MLRPYNGGARGSGGDCAARERALRRLDGLGRGGAFRLTYLADKF